MTLFYVHFVLPVHMPNLCFAAKPVSGVPAYKEPEQYYDDILALKKVTYLCVNVGNELVNAAKNLPMGHLKTSARSTEFHHKRDINHFSTTGLLRCDH